MTSVMQFIATVMSLIIAGLTLLALRQHEAFGCVILGFECYFAISYFMTKNTQETKDE